MFESSTNSTLNTHCAAQHVEALFASFHINCHKVSSTYRQCLSVNWTKTLPKDSIIQNCFSLRCTIAIHGFISRPKSSASCPGSSRGLSSQEWRLRDLQKEGLRGRSQKGRVIAARVLILELSVQQRKSNVESTSRKSVSDWRFWSRLCWVNQRLT